VIDMSIFRTVGSRERLVDRVTTQIRGLITGGELVPGAKLPPQLELAAQLGVSLTVLREALGHLSAEGFVEAKPGVGTMVRRVSQDQILASLDHLLQSDGDGVRFETLHQVRVILETETARIAATKATKESIGNLRTILAETEETLHDPEKTAEQDVALHAALAQMTDNRLLQILVTAIMDLMHQYFRFINYHLDARENIFPFHRRIVEEVASGSEEGAREAMRQHLEQVRKNHEKVAKQLQDSTTTSPQKSR